MFLIKKAAIRSSISFLIFHHNITYAIDDIGHLAHNQVIKKVIKTNRLPLCVEWLFSTKYLPYLSLFRIRLYFSSFEWKRCPQSAFFSLEDKQLKWIEKAVGESYELNLWSETFAGSMHYAKMDFDLAKTGSYVLVIQRNSFTHMTFNVLIILVPIASLITF